MPSEPWAGTSASAPAARRSTLYRPRSTARAVGPSITRNECHIELRETDETVSRLELASRIEGSISQLAVCSRNPGMPKGLKKGDSVEWDTSQGKTRGIVEKR
jgi:hypothetical protein